MSPKQYALYYELCMRRGEPVFPNDQGMSPRDFGMRYIGSGRARKNAIRRKVLAKQ